MIWLIVSLSRNIWHLWSSGAQVEEAEAQLRVLARENYELSQQAQIAERPENIEKEIREKLYLNKPGETVVMLPDKLPNLQGEAKKEEPVELPNWEKWIIKFRR